MTEDHPTLWDVADVQPEGPILNSRDTGSLAHVGWLRGLVRLPGIGPVRALQVAKAFVSVSDLKNASADEVKVRSGVTIPSVEDLQFIDNAVEDDVTLIGYFDEGFPEPLKDLKDPPICIWVRGRVPETSMVAIVGTRQPTRWGSKVAHSAGAAAARAGVASVSGLALGIDTAAHRGSLDAGGITVAIVGSGIDIVTPRSNLDLAAQIVDEGGCILTECEPGVEPSAATLIARNRMQAALGNGLVMAQCGVPSGTLHTVRFAFELGKKIAVPLPPDDEPLNSNAGNRVLVNEKGINASVLSIRERNRWHAEQRRPFADVVLLSDTDVEEFVRRF